MVKIGKKIFLVATERGKYLFPFRTQKSSLSSLMVLHWGRCGRVRRCQEFGLILKNPVSNDRVLIFKMRLQLFSRSSALNRFLQSFSLNLINDFTVLVFIICLFYNGTTLYNTAKLLGNCNAG